MSTDIIETVGLMGHLINNLYGL